MLDSTDIKEQLTETREAHFSQLAKSYLDEIKKDIENKKSVALNAKGVGTTWLEIIQPPASAILTWIMNEAPLHLVSEDKFISLMTEDREPVYLKPDYLSRFYGDDAFSSAVAPIKALERLLGVVQTPDGDKVKIDQITNIFYVVPDERLAELKQLLNPTSTAVP